MFFCKCAHHHQSLFRPASALTIGSTFFFREFPGIAGFVFIASEKHLVTRITAGEELDYLPPAMRQKMKMKGGVVVAMARFDFVAWIWAGL